MKRYKTAIVERNLQVEGHRGLTASLPTDLAEAWENMCVEWDKNFYPKSAGNPYELEQSCKCYLYWLVWVVTDMLEVLSEVQIRLKLAEEEKKHINGADEPLPQAMPSAFIISGLELEDLQ